MFSYRVSGIAFVDTENTKPETFKPLYRYDSALTIPGPCVERLIETCRASIAALPEDAEPLSRAREVMDEVYRAFEYTPGATTIRTTAEEALALGAGVCQDYAHVMLAVCRHVGVAARYIAGMLDGEGATHAWVEVFQTGVDSSTPRTTALPTTGLHHDRPRARLPRLHARHRRVLGWRGQTIPVGQRLGARGARLRLSFSRARMPAVERRGCQRKTRRGG